MSKMKIRYVHFMGYSFSDHGDHRNWMIQFPVPGKYGHGEAVVIISDSHSCDCCGAPDFSSGEIQRISKNGGMDLDYDPDLDPLSNAIDEELESKRPNSIDEAVSVIEEFLSRV